MKIYKVLFLFVALLVPASLNSLAQQTKRQYNLTPSLGYGTENNWGNTGFYAGIAMNTNFTKKILIEAGISYFTSGIYNAEEAYPTFYLNADYRYNALFLNLNVQYVFGNAESLLNAKIKIGPAIKYNDIISLRHAMVYVDPNSSDTLYEIVPGTAVYHKEKGFKLSLYNGISFDAKLNQNLRLGIFLDVYSSLIPVEHFIPGIYATFKLGNRSK